MIYIFQKIRRLLEKIAKIKKKGINLLLLNPSLINTPLLGGSNPSIIPRCILPSRPWIITSWPMCLINLFILFPPFLSKFYLEIVSVRTTYSFRYLLKGQIYGICPSFHQRTIQSNCMTIRLNSHPSCYNYTLQW